MRDAGMLPHRLSSRYRTGENMPTPRQAVVIMFVSFFLASLIPTFSEFFTTVITFYDIRHLYLNPNTPIPLSC